MKEQETIDRKRVFECSTGWTWLLIVLAMVFPTFSSLADFVFFAGDGQGSNPAQQVTYAVGKVVQLLYPLVCLWLCGERLPRPSDVQAPRVADIWPGAMFGLVVAAGLIGLYFVLSRTTALFDKTQQELQQKMMQFGVNSLAGFVGFALFLTLIHSLLEEYYFRWYIYGWLKRLAPLALAVVLSAVAFMAHHVVILVVYFPENIGLAVVPFSLCVAIGGAVWAWLYQRTGSLYTPWVSHLIVDAALFVVGYDLVRPV